MNDENSPRPDDPHDLTALTDDPQDLTESTEDRPHRTAVVAEDESLIRMDIVETLAEAGYEVLAAVGDGEAAVAKARELRPDVVVMDVKMPQTDGVSAWENAVSMTTGARCSSPIRSAAETPSVWGSFTSITTTSGRSSRALATAASPSPTAASTSYPASARVSTMSMRIRLSSSATTAVRWGRSSVDSVRSWGSSVRAVRSWGSSGRGEFSSFISACISDRGP